MEDFTRQRRGLFEGLKVPFCLNALLVAFIGMWVFRLGAMAIEKLGDFEGMFADVFYRIPVVSKLLYHIGVISTYKADIHLSTQWALILIPALWFLLVWCFFAGAINRIFALRIARDETVGFGRALGYGAKKMSTHFFSIFVIFIAIVFFYCCNILAGLVGAIPYVGEFIFIPLYFLVLISSLIITLLIVGGIFGFNLISSSIAVDGVDTFDGISRAYSYVFGRPWQIIIYKVLPVIFLIVFFYFAGLFTKVSLSSPAWLMGDKWKTTAIENTDNTIRTDLKGYYQEQWNVKGATWISKDKEKYLEDTILQLNNYYGKQVSETTIENNPLLKEVLDKVEYKGDMLNHTQYNAAMKLIGAKGEMVGVAAWILKAMIWLVTQLIFAFMIAYWFGAQTKAYFLLRHDVDGDDFEEMYLEEGEENAFTFDFDEPAPAPAPAPVEEEKEEKPKPKRKRRSSKKTEEMKTKKKSTRKKKTK